MFHVDALSKLECPTCGGPRLSHKPFGEQRSAVLHEAVVWCESCHAWFPLEGGVLDLLTGALSYRAERSNFFARHAADMRGLDLAQDPHGEVASADLQSRQQSHFDWYANNDTQSYLEYEQMLFWQAVDMLSFAPWRQRITPGSWLLDVGCGNGRGTFKVADLDLDILAFDVSKRAVQQAEHRARQGGWRARTSFVAADATRFPIRTALMDYVLVYGVLHHVPDPRATCREVARVLHAGGIWFGSENNQTVFRRVFDALQKLRPLWYEEAGPEALISARSLQNAFSTTDMVLQTRTSVFVPPHLVNLLPPRWGTALLKYSDRVATAVPHLKEHGGLILIEGVRL